MPHLILSSTAIQGRDKLHNPKPGPDPLRAPGPSSDTPRRPPPILIPPARARVRLPYLRRRPPPGATLPHNTHLPAVRTPPRIPPPTRPAPCQHDRTLAGHPQEHTLRAIGRLMGLDGGWVGTAREGSPVPFRTSGAQTNPPFLTGPSVYSGPILDEQHSGPIVDEQHSGPIVDEQHSGPIVDEQHSGPIRLKVKG
ncbi:unnamed protein product [Gadus morhua 'NCC']